LGESDRGEGRRENGDEGERGIGVSGKVRRERGRGGWNVMVRGEGGESGEGGRAD